jgi:TonB family protein
MGISKSTQLILVALTAANMLSGTAALAQTATTSDTGRKVKTKVAPVYPDLAARLNVSGKVKLELVITPDGRVKSTRVVGGHPILVQACQDAVKDWKFVAAPEESTQIVEFDFHERQ